MTTSISIILPAKNEIRGLKELLPKLRNNYPESEIIVVDDASDDSTKEFCEKSNVKVYSHPYTIGNGASIKTGARAAQGDILVFLDADGQHDPDDISRLLEKVESGFDMVVGSRAKDAQASFGRHLANTIYNCLSSWVISKKIDDLTSGFRAVRADKFRKFLHLLPNGFSYPTTITMAFFRAGYSVAYVPIKTSKRKGKSHIRYVNDGVRFLLIIFRIGTLYSPLKIFFPVSLLQFVTGLAYYLYTYINYGRFTNMSALLFISSIMIFLIGLISEQITILVYKDTTDK